MKTNFFKKITLFQTRLHCILICTLGLILFIFISIKQGSCESNIDFFFKGTKSKYKDIIVERVISADTFVLQNNEKIKLIGLKAPEPPRKIPLEEVEDNRVGLEKMFPLKVEASADTSIEKKAYDFAKKLVQGKHVRLEFDETTKDRGNRTLCYVFLLDNDLFVNAEILRQGFAALRISPPNTKYENDLRDAHNEAREQQRGLEGEY